VQRLRGEIVGWILRPVEIGTDIGGARAVELVTDEALHDEKRLAAAAYAPFLLRRRLFS
jgi:hypothetical protein